MTFVKICGITNLEDARTAIAAGADLLGFNFYPRSSRYIQPKDARPIIEEAKLAAAEVNRALTMVGVFVNEESPETVLALANQGGVEAVQLHGDETADFCRALKLELKERVLIKALRVDEHFEPEQAAGYEVDAILLDAFHPQLRGGTGRLIDWSIARRTRDLVQRLFLAGGLSPANVGNAIAAVQPYAVDACSALELTPGKKSVELLREFVRAVRSA